MTEHESASLLHVSAPLRETDDRIFTQKPFPALDPRGTLPGMRRPSPSPDQAPARRTAPDASAWMLEAGLLGIVLALIVLALLGTMTLRHAWHQTSTPTDSAVVAPGPTS